MREHGEELVVQCRVAANGDKLDKVGRAVLRAMNSVKLAT